MWTALSQWLVLYLRDVAVILSEIWNVPRYTCEFSVAPWGISVQSGDSGSIPRPGQCWLEEELWQGSWKEAVHFEKHLEVENWRQNYSKNVERIGHGDGGKRFGKKEVWSFGSWVMRTPTWQMAFGGPCLAHLYFLENNKHVLCRKRTWQHVHPTWLVSFAKDEMDPD